MNEVTEKFVWDRADGRCEYCRIPADVSLLPFQVDHIIADKHGGTSDPTNLALCCERCNSFKGPNIAGWLDGKHVPLFNPRSDRWQDHFEWQGPVLVGRSPVGRVTIHVLRINLPYRVAMRAALLGEGLSLD